MGHRVYKSPYGKSGEYTSPSLVLTCAHTQNLYSQSLLLTTKVRHISCMLCFMLCNRNSVHWPISLQGGALEFLSTDPCTFPDMETPSIGPYPSREGHQSFYPWTPAHFRTWKLCLLARIPPGRGTRVFIHGPLHISRHGNSVCWPDPSKEGHWSFYPQTPAHFRTWKLHPLACIPPGRGTGVFIHRSLHISGHGNSVHWPISL